MRTGTLLCGSRLYLSPIHVPLNSICFLVFTYLSNQQDQHEFRRRILYALQGIAVPIQLPPEAKCQFISANIKNWLFLFCWRMDKSCFQCKKKGKNGKRGKDFIKTWRSCTKNSLNPLNPDFYKMATRYYWTDKKLKEQLKLFMECLLLPLNDVN